MPKTNRDTIFGRKEIIRVLEIANDKTTSLLHEWRMDHRKGDRPATMDGNGAMEPDRDPVREFCAFNLSLCPLIFLQSAAARSPLCDNDRIDDDHNYERLIIAIMTLIYLQ